MMLQYILSMILCKFCWLVFSAPLVIEIQCPTECWFFFFLFFGTVTGQIIIALTAIFFSILSCLPLCIYILMTNPYLVDFLSSGEVASGFNHLTTALGVIVPKGKMFLKIAVSEIANEDHSPGILRRKYA